MDWNVVTEAAEGDIWLHDEIYYTVHDEYRDENPVRHKPRANLWATGYDTDGDEYTIWDIEWLEQNCVFIG